MKKCNAILKPVLFFLIVGPLALALLRIIYRGDLEKLAIEEGLYSALMSYPVLAIFGLPFTAIAGLAFGISWQRITLSSENQKIRLLIAGAGIGCLSGLVPVIALALLDSYVLIKNKATYNYFPNVSLFRNFIGEIFRLVLWKMYVLPSLVTGALYVYFFVLAPPNRLKSTTGWHNQNSL